MENYFTIVCRTRGKTTFVFHCTCSTKLNEERQIDRQRDSDRKKEIQKAKHLIIH